MVESSRRDFLKMLGIGAAVAIAPNVIVAPEILAMPVENVIIDKMKLNYFIGDKIYPLGFFESVAAIQKEPPLFALRDLHYLKPNPELEFTLHSEASDRINFNRIFEEIMQPTSNIDKYKPHRLVGQLTSRDNTRRVPKINVVEFNASGMMTEFSDVELVQLSANDTNFITKMKFNYHNMELKTLY